MLYSTYVQYYGTHLPSFRCDLGPHVAIGDVSMCQQMGQLREEEDYHRWVAPEGIREKQFTEKSDVVSHQTIEIVGNFSSVLTVLLSMHRMYVPSGHMVSRAGRCFPWDATRTRK